MLKHIRTDAVGYGTVKVSNCFKYTILRTIYVLASVVITCNWTVITMNININIGCTHTSS